jgi:hypothetical protein
VVGVALPAGAEDAFAGLAAGQLLAGLQVGEGLVDGRVHGPLHTVEHAAHRLGDERRERIGRDGLGAAAVGQ